MGEGRKWKKGQADGRSRTNHALYRHLPLVGEDVDTADGGERLGFRANGVWKVLELRIGADSDHGIRYVPNCWEFWKGGYQDVGLPSEEGVLACRSQLPTFPDVPSRPEGMDATSHAWHGF